MESFYRVYQQLKPRISLTSLIPFLEICAKKNTIMSVENELYYIKVNMLGDHNIFVNIDYVEYFILIKKIVSNHLLLFKFKQISVHNISFVKYSVGRKKQGNKGKNTLSTI